MPKQEAPIVIRLSPTVRDAVAEYAEAEGLELSEAIEALLTKSLLVETKDPDVLARIKALVAVTRFVEDEARTRRDGGDWGRDVTHEIFRRVRDERVDDYAVAVGGNAFATGVEEKGHLNRRLGRRIRRILDAGVEKGTDGKALQENPPAQGGPWLIRSYTPLVRPGA